MVFPTHERSRTLSTKAVPLTQVPTLRHAMRSTFMLLLLLVQAQFSASAQSKDVSKRPFKVGVESRTFTLKKLYNWRGAKTHGLITTVWYAENKRIRFM